MKKASIASRLDAHHRFVYSLIITAIALLATNRIFVLTRLLVGWDAFALSSVILAWIVLCTKDPYEARRHARLQDASVTFLFGIVISAATISLFAVGLVLSLAKALPPLKLTGYVSVSVAAVFLSWMLVHTFFALHYARLYYADAHQKERHHVSGGLIFPGGQSPGYLDFAYFSFVIGMTCQVSDVQVSSVRMRRLALIHGLISFCFNTAILAMVVNIVAGLI